MDTSHELQIAIQAARKVGTLLKKHFETDLNKEIKDDQSIVTIVDRESEKIIKDILVQEFPTYSFLGEEGGLTDNTSEHVWHVDPLDATRNFSNGIPVFAVSIGLEHKGEIIVGVVYNPITDSLFYAEKGKGAYLNDVQIKVSNQDQYQGICTGGTSRDPKDRELFFEILGVFPKNNICAMRYLGCSALDLCYLARGGTEATIQLGLQTYDFAAGVLIAIEAGAKLTNFDGTPWKFPGNYFLASNGVFHTMLLEKIEELKNTHI